MIRFFDLVFSFLGLAFFSPLMVALLIFGTYNFKYPIFIQTRIGLKQKLFNLFKFRSMQLNTQSKATHLIDKDSISKYGFLIRKYKLDELPQLLNVLIGNMSLVGPRPCLFNQKKLVSERKKRGVFKVRPGITGLAQISGINMKTPTLLAKTDQKMIKDMSLYNYFYYIFKTIFKIIK
jgi:lipopolysaccharide/colanic/teichoic acid biosynthesis glycosyltransferase